MTSGALASQLGKCGQPSVVVSPGPRAQVGPE